MSKTNLLERAVDRLVQENIIKEQDKPVYRYGIHQLTTMTLNISIAIVIGLLLDMGLEMLLFLCAYIPLRRYAGGYHAKTELRCSVLSVLSETAALLAIGVFPPHLSAPAIAGAGLLIFFLVPVESKNRPLDDVERRVFRKRGRIILGVHWAAGLVCWYASFSVGLKILSVTDMLMAMMLLLGLIKNAAQARAGSMEHELVERGP